MPNLFRHLKSIKMLTFVIMTNNKLRDYLDLSVVAKFRDRWLEHSVLSNHQSADD